MAQAIRFLSVDDVLEIHEDTIAHEGGLSGMRDLGLLVAAVMMPQQKFDGKHLHLGLASMAAAYLYHVSQNHAFHDGNKRTAAMSALVFLDANGVSQLPDPTALQRMTLSVAASHTDKNKLTSWMQNVMNE